MSQLGMGAMLHMLGGGSRRSANEFYGKQIVAAQVIDDGFELTFEGGERIRIWDDGQSCCESRYMTCDDDVSKIVGGVLRRIEVRDAPDIEDSGEVHEVAFLEIGTDECFVTVATHNEHNGYYGGFGLSIDVL